MKDITLRHFRKIFKHITVPITAACLTAALSFSGFADNNPNIDDRGAGYYTIEVNEYEELKPIYENVPEIPDTISSFEVKKERLENKEADWIEKDGEDLFVSCREFEVPNHRVFLTHILVKDPASQMKVGLSNDTFGGEREYPSDYAKRTGASVVTNGSYFYYETGRPIDVCAPVVINDEQVLRGGTTNGSEICLRRDGSFFSPHPMMSFDSDMLLNFGVVSNFGTADPLLISDGTPMSFPSGVADKVYPRSAIGVVCPGEYYILTAGYDGSYEGGLSYRQMQSVFFHLGCSYARSFDGGGSATLVLNGKLRNLPAEGKERAVVDFLAFYGKPGGEKDNGYRDYAGYSTEDPENIPQQMPGPDMESRIDFLKNITE